MSYFGTRSSNNRIVRGTVLVCTKMTVFVEWTEEGKDGAGKQFQVRVNQVRLA